MLLLQFLTKYNCCHVCEIRHLATDSVPVFQERDPQPGMSVLRGFIYPEKALAQVFLFLHLSNSSLVLKPTCTYTVCPKFKRNDHTVY